LTLEASAAQDSGPEEDTMPTKKFKEEQAAAAAEEKRKKDVAPYPEKLNGDPFIQHMTHNQVKRYAGELVAERDALQAKLDAELARDPLEPYSKEAEKMIAGVQHHMRADRRRVLEGLMAVATITHRVKGDYGVALDCQNSFDRLSAR